MKIGNPDNKAVGVASGERIDSGKTKPRDDAAGATAAAGEPSARVELSLGGALAAAGGTAEFDAAKVERIAQAIRDGRYAIDAEAIADKLIANAQELISRTPR